MGLGAWVAVGAGAAMGAWLRWGLGLMLNSTFPILPLGTLAANLIGGYVMGLVMGIFAVTTSVSPEMRLFATTGFLGGLTTFSAFSAEAVTLMMRAQYGWAISHVLVHVIGSLAMTALGMMTIQMIKN
ncbi:MAG TPA: fluoride efflux transporter CrcB [Methylophilaceae bacterium]|nr:fluoride efflux transporter CrcB [Methylophilaceae bacterium]